MSKRKIKISESQYNRIFKKELNEAGGYDDMGVMAVHGQATTGMLQNAVKYITKMLDDLEEAFKMNMSKDDMLGGVTAMSQVLSDIKDALRKVTPELVNDDLKFAAKNLYKEVQRSEKKLRLLVNQSQSTQHPNMPPAVTGMAFAMGQEDFNDYIFNVLMDLGNAAEKLAFQVRDEIQVLTKRFRGESPDDDYGYN